MNNAWEEIRADYQKAKNALWYSKDHGKEYWYRDEKTGYYYMWKAYHHACETEPKDYLLFARIK